MTVAGFCWIYVIACNMGLLLNEEHHLQCRTQQLSFLPHPSFAMTYSFNLNSDKSPKLKIINHFSVMSSMLHLDPPTAHSIQLRCTHIYETPTVGFKLLHWVPHIFKSLFFIPDFSGAGSHYKLLKDPRNLHIMPVIYPQRLNTLGFGFVPLYTWPLWHHTRKKQNVCHLCGLHSVQSWGTALFECKSEIVILTESQILP